MDIDRILRELVEERGRLDRIIRSLEAGGTPGSNPKGRLLRKGASGGRFRGTGARVEAAAHGKTHRLSIHPEPTLAQEER